MVDVDGVVSLKTLATVMGTRSRAGIFIMIKDFQQVSSAGKPRTTMAVREITRCMAGPMNFWTDCNRRVSRPGSPSLRACCRTRKHVGCEEAIMLEERYITVVRVFSGEAGIIDGTRMHKPERFTSRDPEISSDCGVRSHGTTRCALSPVMRVRAAVRPWNPIYLSPHGT